MPRGVPYFEHIVDFLLTDSHSLRSWKNRALKYVAPPDPQSRFPDRSRCDHTTMYGHDSVLTGKAISAVLGEERGRLKERIKAYRKQLSAIQLLELHLRLLKTFVCLSFYPMDWS